MYITKKIRIFFLAAGYEIRKMPEKVLPNKHLSLKNWDYQKKMVLSQLPENGIVFDLGSGHNPVPEADILGDFFPEDTYHRGGALVEDRPLIVCSVERIPILAKKIDFVICSHILEHVDSPIRAGNELSRIAKAGYIETPAYGKDILIGTGDMHRWQVVEFEGEMHFFEYSERQHQAHSTSPVMSLWCSPDYHSWQDFFWDRQDLFNAMYLWKDQTVILEHRRKKSQPVALMPWKPVGEDSLSDTPVSLTDKEIRLLEQTLSSPDGLQAMNYSDGKFVSVDGKSHYPVRGKRIYFEMMR